MQPILIRNPWTYVHCTLYTTYDCLVPEWRLPQIILDYEKINLTAVHNVHVVDSYLGRVLKTCFVERDRNCIYIFSVLTWLFFLREYRALLSPKTLVSQMSDKNQMMKCLRKYCVIYRGPGFLEVEWLGSSPTPLFPPTPPFPVIKLSPFLSIPACVSLVELLSLPTGKGEEGVGEEPKSILTTKWHKHILVSFVRYCCQTRQRSSKAQSWSEKQKRYRKTQFLLFVDAMQVRNHRKFWQKIASRVEMTMPFSFSRKCKIFKCRGISCTFDETAQISFSQIFLIFRKPPDSFSFRKKNSIFGKHSKPVKQIRRKLMFPSICSPQSTQSCNRCFLAYIQWWG